MSSQFTYCPIVMTIGNNILHCVSAVMMLVITVLRKQSINDLMIFKLDAVRLVQVIV